MKIGCIKYLNCYPFYYHMFEKRPLAGVDVIAAHPSELNRMMTAGELAISPVSSAAYADLQDDAFLLPDFCLSSVGYVRSVIMISRLPVEELDGRRVGLSTASQTSVVLLKMLLGKYYGLKPEYVQSPPMPSLKELDAALVIGNEAMAQFSEPVPYVYDLGDLWLRKSGHPVVFAVFAVNKGLADSEKIDAVISSYRESLKCLETERDELILQAGRRYPEVMYDIDTYYKLLKFDFSSDLKKALKFYFEEAWKMGLLRKVQEIKYYGLS
jgi:chorismate dehydratase